jgi:hypothetical protein
MLEREPEAKASIPIWALEPETARELVQIERSARETVASQWQELNIAVCGSLANASTRHAYVMSGCKKILLSFIRGGRASQKV